MGDLLVIVTLGFLLGMRHATDADHVVAVTTIVTRQRDILAAALTGLMWGIGHTLTIVAVGVLIIVFNVVIPFRIGVGMELSVGVMLVVLGAVNVWTWRRSRTSPGGRVHSHGGHADPPGTCDGQDVDSRVPTTRASVGWRFGPLDMYVYSRPVVVGIVHGLAGSAAVALLVVASVGDPRWSVVYLLVFGLGTVAGMMLITISLASAFRLASGRSEFVSRRLGLWFGLASVAFGVSFAYQTWSAAAILP